MTGAEEKELVVVLISTNWHGRVRAPTSSMPHKKAWERLGNQGWSYKDVLPYIQKVENFRTPSNDTVKAKLLAEDQPWFGKNGPISIAFCEVLTGLEDIVRTTVNGRGIPTINNAPLGEYTGMWSGTSSMDPEKLERATAFKGYVQPHLDRKNLFVLPEAYVTKLIWKDPNPNLNGELTAKGVEFIHGGKTFVVNSTKEVLVTAGTLKTPQILELSGIGNRTILEPLNIPVLVDLPGVGENLQDHYCASTIVWELTSGGSYRTLDLLLDPVQNQKYEELYKQKQRGLVSFTNTEFVFASLQSLSPNADKIIALHEKDLANRVASMDTDAEKGLKEQLNIQLERIKNPNAPMIELIFAPIFLDFPNSPEPNKMYLSVLITLVGTWARGSAHISSADPLKSPDLDGNALAYKFELDTLSEAFKFARQLKDYEPLKSIIAKEISPGGKVVTDEEIYGENRFSTPRGNHVTEVLHSTKSVSKPRLTLYGVYGTTNVRVCDLSITPLQGNVHTQCITYAIAEKAADIILKRLIDCSVAHLSRPGSSQSCLSISLLGRGSYNTVYRLTFSDGTQLAASIANHDDEDFNAQAKQSEIETMKFVRESGLYPDIPIPKVHAWDTTFNNPAGAPYVLMDVVQGETLEGLKDDNGLHGLDTLPHIQQLSIVKTLAKLKASLSKPVPFDKIGSIAANSAKDGYFVGPLITFTQECLGGPFKSAHELWRSRLEHGILHAIEEWCKLENDQLSTSLSEPNCTPQTFAELFQLLSSLITHFMLPQSYDLLVLHHPDLALRNIFFDKKSFSSNQPKITGVIDWGGAQILPLMLTARYPDDLMTTTDEPFSRSGYSDESWHSVPSDWTSIGDVTQWPQVFRGPGDPVDYTPRVSAMVRRFYLRTYFSACYAEQIHLLQKDASLYHATLFADAPYYLKFHETICGGWTSWVEHASWIRETYWRLRTLPGQGAGEESLVIGPNVYRGSIVPVVRDLGIFEETSYSGSSGNADNSQD
ncbi:hypothetical protein Clacol_003272 [Clathrus columnatus]|uniref:Glucose-methanol-choline oxidoreductase N-terminal domain-containing protein n=1 Tax=Clathrus columnatus TaxID=1419009 RepID=A0AAV5A7U0_9AGAM|nr:hypothetical protein Clacol_003272 [Clathrus columnatus]